jgi:hypothetical protein
MLKPAKRASPVKVRAASLRDHLYIQLLSSPTQTLRYPAPAMTFAVQLLSAARHHGNDIVAT